MKVRLDDVTRADARAETVARMESDPVSAETGEECRVTFAIDVDDADIDPRARYVVAAHADLDADGQVGRGDYVTMQSYPVLTRGYPSTANLQLCEVE